MTASAVQQKMRGMTTEDVRPPIEVALRFGQLLFACVEPDIERHDGEAIAIHRRSCKLIRKGPARRCTCSPVIVRHPVHDR